VRDEYATLVESHDRIEELRKSLLVHQHMKMGLAWLWH